MDDETFIDKEKAHFEAVCRAFRKYSYNCCSKIELNRRWWNLMSPKLRNFINENDEYGKFDESIEACRLNQNFLNSLLCNIDDFQELRENYSKFEDKPDVNEINFFKVVSTLKQFCREWSEEFQKERNGAFEPLIQSIKHYIPIDDENNPPKILVPGCALGRLAFDIRRLGYTTQGNEFSVFMLIGSSFILNHKIPLNYVNLKPFVLDTINMEKKNANLKNCYLPDVAIDSVAGLKGEFSIVAGDFLEIYSNQTAEWDGVATSFFLDTARNVVLYILVIANLLKENGLWTNIGPLLYHFSGSTTSPNIELSYQKLKDIISKYFTIKDEESKWLAYTNDPDSMMRRSFKCMKFNAIRNSFSVDPELIDTKNWLFDISANAN